MQHKKKHINLYFVSFIAHFSSSVLPIFQKKNDAISLHLLAQAGDDERNTSGSGFSLVTEENQMWLTGYTNPLRRWNSTAHFGILCFSPPSETSAEAGLDAQCQSLLPSGVKVKRKMMMPISRTIITTTDVSRKARHAGLPVSRIRASLRPLAAL